MGPAFLLSLLVGAVPQNLTCDRVLDDFSASEAGRFPVDWKTKYDHNAEEARSAGLYRVELDGDRKVLHATYGTHTVTIVRAVTGWDMKRYPYLQWRWKAVRLPNGGDESSRDTNDSAASVYLAWRAMWPVRAKTLRFVWSSSLPVARQVSRRFGNDKIVVATSGPAAVGTWQTVRVAAGELAQSEFGADEAPDFIALTTDADDTRSTAEAFYADFRLCRNTTER